jgi:predicted nucleic acid-binding protein
MRVDEGLLGVSRLFLDTSPVIYFVEENPAFSPVVNVIFDRIENTNLVGVATPITLAECLVVPYRTNDVIRQQEFVELLTNTENIEFLEIDQTIGRQAGELRARYNLQLPDALQIATALATGCTTLLTNDIQMQQVTELQVLVISELEG